MSVPTIDQRAESSAAQSSSKTYKGGSCSCSDRLPASRLPTFRFVASLCLHFRCPFPA